MSDPPGETFYVRDEETGALWGPTLLPIREDASPYVARHGQGYSRFEHTSHGIALELLQFVPLEDPVKISRLTIENRSGTARRLSVTAYVEWVLGVSRSANAPSIVTEIDPATGALLARNAWNADFAGRVAFADLRGRQTAWTADRAEFLGRNGTLDHPAMLERGTAPSGRVGAGLDPCAALQVVIELAPGGRAEIVFLLGQGDTLEAARALVVRYRAADVALTLKDVTTQWDDTLGAIQVKTPDRSMDLMLNRWLLYQTLACRVWARSAFYQAGGAYGFRDQLQDVMALVGRAARGRARAPAARRRPAVRRGRRPALVAPALRPRRPHPDLRRLRSGCPTRSRTTSRSPADAALLDELVPFLEGPPLAAGRTTRTSSPASPRERRRSSSTARARSTAAWPSAPTAFR